VASFPEGVYRVRRTRADVLRIWPNAGEADLRAFTALATLTFEKGRFDLVLSGGGIPGCRHANGTYSTAGQFVSMIWTDFHGCPKFDGQAPSPPEKLRWSTDTKTLTLRTTGPAFVITRVTWEAKPWVRIR
jgi:hypothetical protein